MRIVGNLIFAGLGQIQNLRVENLASDPGTPSVGQIWYNTVEGAYKGWDGTTVFTFATGGNTGVLVSEIDAIETAVGLGSSGTYTAPGSTNYLGATTTVVGAAVALDSALKTVSTATTAAQAKADAVQAELDASQTSAGLNADGSFTAPTGTNYLGSATTLKSADVLLDSVVKAVSDAASAAQSTADLKVAKAGDSMTGNLAFGGTSKVIGLAAPTAAGDATNKAYVDNLVNGLFWLNPVDARLAVAPGTAAIGYRFLSSADGKIFTATAVNTFDAGVAPVSGQAVMVKSDESGWTTDGTNWVQFTGAGQITAGVGLRKDGNVIDVNLGAGIGQLPSDEVGVDVSTVGGLFTTVDGTTPSTNTDAQLAIKLDGVSLQTTTNGLAVKASGVTETELSASVAGNGLVGGAGTPLAVVAGTGISVSADDVGLDLTYTDARYLNTTGDTLTGPLLMAADPTAALGAATKQYVDAVNARLTAGTFVYTGVTSSTTHTVIHGMNNQFNTVTVYDSADKVIIPESITADSVNQLTVTFASAITCKVVVTGIKN